MTNKERQEEIRIALRIDNNVPLDAITKALGYDSIEDILNSSRKKITVLHRHIVSSYLYGQGVSLEDVGRLVSRNHATVSHSRNTILNLLDISDKPLLKELQKLRSIKGVDRKIICPDYEIDALKLLQDYFDTHHE